MRPEETHKKSLESAYCTVCSDCIDQGQLQLKYLYTRLVSSGLPDEANGFQLHVITAESENEGNRVEVAVKDAQ